MDLNLPRGKCYYTIGEVAEAMGVNASLLRFWEKEFEMVKPKKNKRGKRFYAAADIERLKRIHELVRESGFTLAGARQKLKRRKSLSTMELISKLDAVKAELTNIKNEIPT
ncbi:MAG: MerR family transcriptional regulator [Flavobacteriales bacterium]